MRIGQNEIIEELSAHMRKFGGEPGEWCVGTAKDLRGVRAQETGDGEAVTSVAEIEEDCRRDFRTLWEAYSYSTRYMESAVKGSGSNCT